ncbi:hypothetical protein AAMO2058_000333600 [Amorphochlora amoebiformis]
MHINIHTSNITFLRKEPPPSLPPPPPPPPPPPSSPPPHFRCPVKRLPIMLLISNLSLEPLPERKIKVLELYRACFQLLVFIGPSVIYQLPKAGACNHASVQSLPCFECDHMRRQSYVRGIKPFFDTWAYACGAKAALFYAKTLKNVKGYLYLHADMFITPKFLISLEKQVVNRNAFMIPQQPGLKEWPVYDTAPITSWWKPSFKGLMKALRTIRNGSSSTPIAISGGWIDVYYVPVIAFKSVWEYTREFSINGVSNEIAIPTTIHSLAAKFNFPVVQKFCAGGCCDYLALEVMDREECGHRIAMHERKHQSYLTNVWNSKAAEWKQKPRELYVGCMCRIDDSNIYRYVNCSHIRYERSEGVNVAIPTHSPICTEEEVHSVRWFQNPPKWTN